MAAGAFVTRTATVMILAAGEGRRLQPLTHSVPKPLLPVAGVPLLLRTLRALLPCGFTRTVVNVHHLAAQVDRALAASEFAARVAISREASLLGTGGGIRHAVPLWQGDAAWIFNGDVVCDADVRAHEARIPSAAVAHMILRPLPAGASRAGAVYLERATPGTVSGAARRVIGVRDQGDLAGEPFAFTGIHWMRRDRALGLREPGDVIADGYVPWIEQGLVSATVHDGYWIDIGTPDTLAQIEADVRAGVVVWG